MNMIKQSNGMSSSLASLIKNDGIDFQKVVGELYRHLWTIAGISAATFFCAFLYTFTIVPQYQTTALIQVSSQNSNQGIGGLGNISSLKMNATSNIDTQIALIKTRYIMEPVVVENGLNISIQPNYFPIFGKWYASHHKGSSIASPLLWLKSYAWGGEILKIQKLEIPPSYIGQQLKFVVDHDNTFKLFSPTGNLLLTGSTLANTTATNSYGFTLLVNEIRARPGTEFTLSVSSPISMAKNLANSLTITPIEGNDPSQKTGLLQLQLKNADPTQAPHLLDTIISFAIAKNTQQKIKDTQRTIEFLKKRLPEAKKSLEAAENALNKYHENSGTLSMNIVSRLLVSELTNTEQGLQKVRAQKEELLQLYTPEHPLVQATEHKELALLKKLNDLKSQIRKFPFIHQGEIDLERESRIKNATYISLLNNRQQIELVKAGISSDITALGSSTPAERLPTHKIFIMLLGLLAGAFAASSYFLIKAALSKTIANATELEDALNIPVQSIVPYSRAQRKMEKMNSAGLSLLGSQASPLILAKREPDDIAIESIRSLRISLHIMSQTQHPIIGIMGSLSNIGKSFVALNLSQVMADAGQRTLLIDADVRKGLIHTNLLQPKVPGLCEYLEAKSNYEDIIRRIDENVYFIANGNFSRQPLELFNSPKLSELIERARQDFDQIIIDMPPIIPVSDSILLSKFCDVKLFVVSAGRDSMADVKQAINKAQTHGVAINGLVFNHTKPMGPYGSKLEYKYAYGNKS